MKCKIVSWTKISKIWRWKETAVQIIKGVLLQITHISQSSRHLYKGVKILLCFKRKWQIVALQLLSSSLRFVFKHAFALLFPSSGVSVLIKFGQYYPVGSSWSGSTAQQKWYTFSILPLSIGIYERNIFHSLFAELNVNNC